MALALAVAATACGGGSDSGAGDPSGLGGDAQSDDASVDDDQTAGADSSGLQPDDEPATSPDSGEGEDRGAELVGRWEIVNYELSTGGLTNVLGEGVHITFEADGTVTYFNGCNDGSSTYTTSGGYYVPESALDDRPEGQTITLGPTFTQTEIGCEGFLGDQDVDIPARFAEATRFVLDGDELRLLDEFLLVVARRAP